MAYDQYGNYIPDPFGGQPIMAPPMAAMRQAQTAPPPNMAPVIAQNARGSIAPTGMQQMGPLASPDSFDAASLASKLREGAVDKEGNPISFADRVGNKWDKAMKRFDQVGNDASAAYDWATKKFGALGGLFD